MAKQTAAPAPAPEAKGQGSVLISGGDQPPEVVQWGNGGPADGQEEDQPEATPAGKPPGKDKPNPEAQEVEGEPKPDAEAEPRPDADKPEADAAPESDAADKTTAEKPVSSDRRKQIIASLAAERAKNAMTKQLEDARKAADDARKAQEDFDKLPLAQKLSLIAKKHGMSVQDLADRLLINGEDVQDSPPAARAPDPEVAALKATVTALTERLQKQDDTEQQTRVQQAIGRVRETLKDTDLPLIDTFDAYGRIMMNAHDAWSAGGKQGSPMDYVSDCAAVVEEELKAEHPKAAARLYPKARQEPEDVESEEMPPARPARPAVGRRVAARPDAKPQALPLDEYERDQAIKKRFGWQSG